MRTIAFLIISSFVCARPAWADPAADALEAMRLQVTDLTRTVQQLTGTVQAQAERIAQLERGPAPITTGSPSSAAPGAPTRVPVVGGSLSGFNPEIGVLADIVGQVSESSADGEGNDKISAREMELVIGHPIDPYSRLDTTVAFSDFEEPALEEAYITHWGIPEVKARIGRFRPKVGKINPVHRDSIETVDEPLVIASYLGAEGLSRTGLELSGFLPLPWDAVTHELTAGLMEGGVGEGANLFGEVRRRPSYYARLKNFWDISDVSSVELGATYLAGSRDDDSDLEVQALGLDATLVHHVTPTNKLKFQNELYLQDRDESVSVAEDGTETLFPDNPWGFYSLVDYRVSPRLGVGGRFDYVELIDADTAALARRADTAWSGYLTFYQSEFARWRLQYRRTDFAYGGSDNTVFLQGTVAIGVHKHQIQ